MPRISARRLIAKARQLFRQSCPTPSARSAVAPVASALRTRLRSTRKPHTAGAFIEGLESRAFLSAAVINPRWIKPLDTGTLEFFARSVDVICTLEDHVLHNGFGCAIIEHLNDAGIKTPVVRVGWPDQFIEHGAVEILRKKHGLTAEVAVEKVLAALAEKKPARGPAQSVA